MGLLGVAQFLPGPLFGLLAGVWLDRTHRLPVVVGSQLVNMAALATIPAAPYLRAPAAGQDWAARLGPDRPKIGLAWAGNPRHVNDRNRSVPLSAMLSLLDVAATFVTLQKDFRDGDDATLARSRVLNLGPALQDFADSAALMAELDLVITVDTSVAHLAGALGAPRMAVGLRARDHADAARLRRRRRRSA